MRTYKCLPKKYYGIETNTIKVIGGYAYTVRHNNYSGHRDYVYRMPVEEYNAMREEAKSWDGYRCDPTEESLQLQIACWLAGTEPYIQTTKYF